MFDIHLANLLRYSAVQYVCVTDSEGAASCEKAQVTVMPPREGFSVADALSGLDVGSLAATGDVSVLAAGAAALVAMGDFVSSGGAEAQDVQAILASKSGALIDSLAGSAAQMAADSQSMQQARRAKCANATCTTARRSSL